MDLVQNRKCVDFKRMMLESVGPSGGVGIPIPLGYESVLVRECTDVVGAIFF